MSGRSFEQEAELPRENYFAGEYLQRKQFDALVSQIVAVTKLKPRTVLEVGPGNGFVTNFLRSSGIKVTTFDINQNLRPDVLGNLLEIQEHFKENTFDLVLCAEVLEHLPYKYFEAILKSFDAIAKHYVVITLPRQHRILLDYRMVFKVPFFPFIHSNIFFRIPNRTKWVGHHWEIDYRRDYSLKKIKGVMEKYFIIRECYVDERVRYHQFFVLQRF